VLHAKRHEAVASVDSSASFVIEQEVAGNTDAIPREQTRDLVYIVFDRVGQHVRENGSKEDEVEAMVWERKTVRRSGY